MATMPSANGLPVLLIGVLGLAWAVMYLGLHRVTPGAAIPACLQTRVRRTRAAVPAVVCLSLLLIVGGWVALP